MTVGHDLQATIRVVCAPEAVSHIGEPVEMKHARQQRPHRDDERRQQQGLRVRKAERFDGLDQPVPAAPTSRPTAGNHPATWGVVPSDGIRAGVGTTVSSETASPASRIGCACSRARLLGSVDTGLAKRRHP